MSVVAPNGGGNKYIRRKQKSEQRRKRNSSEMAAIISGSFLTFNVSHDLKRSLSALLDKCIRVEAGEFDIPT
jgi:hypothetical protein